MCAGSLHLFGLSGFTSEHGLTKFDQLFQVDYKVKLKSPNDDWGWDQVNKIWVRLIFSLNGLNMGLLWVKLTMLNKGI